MNSLVFREVFATSPLRISVVLEHLTVDLATAVNNVLAISLCECVHDSKDIFHGFQVAGDLRVGARTGER